MSAASWFRLSKYALPAALSRSVRRKPARRPAHSRPSLECLEERVVPDGASGNLGIVTNGGVNFQGGITLVPNPPSADLSGIAVGTFASPFNASGALNLAQQGLNLPSNVTNFTQTAFGFGSGVQPNQPWVPNAYNLGLANQQWAYPSLSDRGFQATPPWTRQIAHLQKNNGEDAPDEQLTLLRTFLATHERAEAGDPIDQLPADDEDGASSEEWNNPDSGLETRSIPLVPHTATVTEEGDLAAGRATLSFREANAPEGKMASVPFSEGQDAQTLISEDGEAKPTISRTDDLFAMDEGEKIVPVLQRLDLSSTLMLSVLTPAQFMALLREFPAPAAPRDDREKDESLNESA